MAHKEIEELKAKLSTREEENASLQSMLEESQAQAALATQSLEQAMQEKSVLLEQVNSLQRYKEKENLVRSGSAADEVQRFFWKEHSIPLIPMTFTCPHYSDLQGSFNTSNFPQDISHDIPYDIP